MASTTNRLPFEGESLSEVPVAERPPEPDFSAMTEKELVAYREAENRWRASSAARAILGNPDPGAAIGWQRVALPGRDLPVRVYRSRRCMPTT
ncbi:hypothetical protein [Sphaerisporangium fuscum]|uniref:hypothetical protein n=1 Tax=Sphaerisporangium fuscum TaxID=2835868 RepID=UPI0020299DDD|nr:hypothetical protein [Sphaerisporangium fuscum]